jgi:hypothetical protein
VAPTDCPARRMGGGRADACDVPGATAEQPPAAAVPSPRLRRGGHRTPAPAYGQSPDHEPSPAGREGGTASRRVNRGATRSEYFDPGLRDPDHCRHFPGSFGRPVDMAGRARRRWRTTGAPVQDRRRGRRHDPVVRAAAICPGADADPPAGLVGSGLGHPDVRQTAAARGRLVVLSGSGRAFRPYCPLGNVRGESSWRQVRLCRRLRRAERRVGTARV